MICSGHIHRAGRAIGGPEVFVTLHHQSLGLTVKLNVITLGVVAHVSYLFRHLTSLYIHKYLPAILVLEGFYSY